MHNITIGVIGSHSALDICRGAKAEGFKTLVVAEKGRERTYDKYYKTKNNLGCVDECIVLDKFSDIITIQGKLNKRNVIFIPNRSFEVYMNFDYEAIETSFKVPMFGNKYLLKIEERGRKPNQYDLLKAAHISYPKQFTNPKDIDRLCIIKVLESKRKFERAFFFAKNYNEYETKSKKMIDEGIITQKGLNSSVIEEYIIGTQVNFNFFYSPLSKRLELLGTDTRRQTNYEGFTNLPAKFQKELDGEVNITFEEAGHIAVTVLESLLEKVFALGEQFVEATQKISSPGIIGPFALQCIITSGPPQKDIIVIDVSPRMPGSPGIYATPYSDYLFGKPMSVGRRVALEIKQSFENNSINTITT